MKSFSQSHAKKIFSAFAFSVFLIFTSCEGFFNDNDLEQKIKAAIDYANAPISTFVVSADSNAGTIIPSGQVQYKPTDLQNIEFTCKPGYEFIRWSFTYKMISQGEDTPTLTTTDPDWWKEYITIKKETQSEPNSKGEIVYTLQIQFINAVENLLIEPVCSLKPKLDRYPDNKAKGQSRDEELSFTFNTPIDKDSIFFSQQEIAAIEGVTEVLKNRLGEIYGYVKDEKTYFKNIEIVMSDTSRNINESYKDITLKEDKKSLVIFSNGKSPVQFSTTTAEIKILFKDGIKSTDGASMYETIISLTLNKDTNEKSWIAVITDKNAAVINYIEYNKGEEQRATFTETSDIQFLGWYKTCSETFPDSKDNVTIKINEDDSKKITFWGNEVISRDEEVRIVALYEPRPTYEWIYAANTTYEKDTSIVITFDHQINAASFKDNYSLSIDGYSVKANFNEPQVVYDAATDKTTITIVPKNGQDRLVLASNKTITLTIPSALFYTVTEPDGQTYDIVLGKNKEVSYAVTPFTSSKALVKVSNSNTNYGTIKDKDGNNFTLSQSNYSVDQSFVLTFVPAANSAYAFAGWDISDTLGNLSVTDTSEETITVTIIDSVQSANGTPSEIKPLYEPKLDILSLRVNGMYPDNAYANNQSYPKDSTFYLILTKQSAPEINLRNYISVFFGTGNTNTDEDVTSVYFSVFRSDLDIIRIQASSYNRLPVTAQKNKLTIKVNGDFYYTLSNGIRIPLKQDYQKTITLNETTYSKAKVEVKNPYTSPSRGTIYNGQGQTFTLGEAQHSIDETFTLDYVAESDYEFIRWDVSNNTSLISLSSPESSRTDVTVLTSSTSKATITPVVEPKLKVESFVVGNQVFDDTNPFNENYTFYKDSEIELKFNQNLPSVNIRNYITLLLGDTDVTSKYKMNILGGSDTKTVKITPRERLSLSETQNLSIIVDKSLYYKYSDTRNITLGSDFTQIIKLNTETNSQAYVQVLANDNGTIKDSTGEDFPLTKKSYSLDKTFELNFIPDDGYEFLGWKVEGAYTGNGTIQNINDTVINVVLSNPKDKTTTVTVVDAVGYLHHFVTIEPVVAQKLKVSGIWINSQTYNQTSVYPKDATISIRINKSLQGYTGLGNYVKLKYNGVDVVANNYFYFNTSFNTSANTTTFTFTPVSGKFLDITNMSSLVVTVDRDLYYIEDPSGFNKTLTLGEDYEKYVQINAKTSCKIVLDVVLDDIEDLNENCGRITQSISRDNKTYYGGETIDFEAILDEYYEITEWTLTSLDSPVHTASNDVTFTSNGNKASLTVKANTSNYKLTAKARPKFVLLSVSPTLRTNSSSVPFYEYVVLTFNKKINCKTMDAGTPHAGYTQGVQFFGNSENGQFDISSYFDINWNTATDDTCEMHYQVALYSALKTYMQEKKITSVTVKILKNIIKAQNDSPLEIINPAYMDIGKENEFTYEISFSRDETVPPYVEDSGFYTNNIPITPNVPLQCSQDILAHPEVVVYKGIEYNNTFHYQCGLSDDLGSPELFMDVKISVYMLVNDQGDFFAPMVQETKYMTINAEECYNYESDPVWFFASFNPYTLGFPEKSVLSFRFTGYDTNGNSISETYYVYYAGERS